MYGPINNNMPLYGNNTYSLNQRDYMGGYSGCFCLKSYFRILNAVSGSQPLDVYLNEMILASNLKYGEFSRYIKVMPGNYKITVYISGRNKDPIFEASISIGKNLAYTGALTGRADDPSELGILMIPDAKENQIMNNMSAVKVVNLIPGSIPTNLVTDDGAILFSGMGYGDITGNVALPAGRYTLYLRAGSDEKNILTAPNVDFAPKMFYTLYLTGELDGQSSPRVEMLIPEDGVNYLDLC